MLTETEINEILDSREALTEFVTTAMIETVSAGLKRVRDPDASATFISQYMDVLRKMRSDLTGDNQHANMPTMMVNIQFNNGQNPAPASGTQELPVIETNTLVGAPPSALSHVSNF